MAIVKRSDLPKIRKRHKNQKIVYCDGTFDLTHAGHVLHFEDCKKHGDILVVGTGTDKMIRRYKGPERPVLNERVRLKTIDSFKPVDYCFLFHIPGNKNLLSGLSAHFKSLKPDIYAINKDAFDIPYRKKVAKKFGVRLVIMGRTCPPEFDAISTSKIIEKIEKLVKPK